MMMMMMMLMMCFVLFSFGLFEGMSAIEMMDPKMDAGMMCNQTKRKVLTLQQSVEVSLCFPILAQPCAAYLVD